MLSVEKLVSDPIVILGNKICLNIVNPFSCRACVLVFSFNFLFFLYLFYEDYIQAEAISNSPQHRYRQ